VASYGGPRWRVRPLVRLHCKQNFLSKAACGARRVAQDVKNQAEVPLLLFHAEAGHCRPGSTCRTVGRASRTDDRDQHFIVTAGDRFSFAGYYTKRWTRCTGWTGRTLGSRVAFWSYCACGSRRSTWSCGPLLPLRSSLALRTLWTRTRCKHKAQYSNCKAHGFH
jgi:hypothetical protein